MEALRAKALELAAGLPDSASNISRVARRTSVEASGWAFTQWVLRKKAVAKGFPKAEQMLFTRESLEQASNFSVARYHASRFPSGALVADLTCGIGSDLLALAERGPVVGFDLDAERLEYAEHNLAVHGFSGKLVLGDCLVANWDFEFALGDPSRRVEGRRTIRAEEFSPNPADLGEKMESLQLGMMKLSPLLPDALLATFGPRSEFVSFGGECREVLVSRGREAAAGVFATKVETRDSIPSGPALMEVDEPFEFFYEANPALIRAHAMGSLPGAEEVAGLGDSNGYLTSTESFASEWLTPYRVLDSGRYDAKSVRAKLREMGGGVPIVKSRAGASADVARVTKELKSNGNGEPIVALYAVGKSVRYAILERIQPPF